MKQSCRIPRVRSVVQFFFLSVLMSGSIVAHAKDIKDAVLADLLTKNKDIGTYGALKNLAERAFFEPISVEEAKRIGTTNNIIYPKLKGSIVDSVSFNALVVGVSVPTKDLNIVNDQGLKDMYWMVQRARAVYESSDSSPGQKLAVSEFMQTYFNFDISVSEEDVRKISNLDLTKLQVILDYMDKNGDEQTKKVLDSIQSTTNEAVAANADEFQRQAKIIMDKVKTEAANIKAAVDESTAPSPVDFSKMEKSIENVEELALRAEVRGEVKSLTNSEALLRLEVEAQSCQVSEGTSRCNILKEELTSITKRKEQILRHDKANAAIGSLSFVKEMSVLFGDTKTAEAAGKGIQAISTVTKIADMAADLATKTALASFGDVMSMAGMAVSVVNLFSSSGPSADEMILQELFLIRQAIQELRVEMHQRFDELSSQMAHLGLGLDLKVQQTNENLLVLADNQAEIFKELESARIQISSVSSILANQEISRILRRVMEDSEVLRSDQDPQSVKARLLGTTAAFKSYLDYIDRVKILWEAPVAVESGGFTSPESFVITKQLAQQSGQQSFAQFSLIDFLIRQGDCSVVDFSSVFFFNAIGSVYLPVLNERYTTLNSELIDQSKVLHLVRDQSMLVDGNQLSKQLSETLLVVDRTVDATNSCLQRYRLNSDGKVQNFVQALLDQYATKVEGEVSRLKEKLQSQTLMTGLTNAVQSPQSSYFSEINPRPVALDPNLLDLRKYIDPSNIDLLNSIEQQQEQTQSWFYEKFKTISVCESAEVDLRKRFNPQNSPPIQLPKDLMLNVFKSIPMLTGLKLGLNHIQLCYKPGLDSYREDLDDEVNGTVRIPEALVGFYLVVKPVTNAKYDSALYNKRRAPFFDSYSEVKIPVFVPRARFKVASLFVGGWETENGAEETLEGRFGNSRRRLRVPGGEKFGFSENFLTQEGFNSYAASQLQTEKWQCSTLPWASEILNMCWVEGFAPDAGMLQRWAQHLTTITNDNLPGYGSQANAFVAQLATKGLQQSLDQIKLDLGVCYRRSLLGFSDCRFEEFLVLTPLAEKVDYSELNQLEAHLRVLLPLLAKFKEEVPTEKRQKFVDDLNSALVSPANEILALAAQGNPLFYTELKASMLKKGELLRSLTNEAGGLLTVDASQMVQSETYDGIKFYRDRIAEIISVQP